jgi:hypothetical protein
MVYFCHIFCVTIFYIILYDITSVIIVYAVTFVTIFIIISLFLFFLKPWHILTFDRKLIGQFSGQCRHMLHYIETEVHPDSLIS